MSQLSELLHEYAPQSGWGTFFTAAFGAFAGAVAASRAHYKRELIAELNALSAAHELCVSVANRFLALKKQQIKPLKEQHIALGAAHKKHMKAHGTGEDSPDFKFVADLQSISRITVPIDAIEKAVFEKTSTRGRALAALIELRGAIDGLTISISSRADLVDEQRAGRRSERDTLNFILGLRTSNGHIDNRFNSNIEALSAQVNDCIFFARILATDIVNYSDRLRKRRGLFYRLSIPKMHQTDWSPVETAALMPSDQEYANWLCGFPLQKPRRAWLKCWATQLSKQFVQVRRAMFD